MVRRHRAWAIRAGALVVCSFGPTGARAQQAIQTPAATQAGAGVWSLRELVRFTRFDNDPTGLDRDGDRVEIRTILSYGITGSLSASLETPLIWQDVDTPDGSETDLGLDDPRLSVKWRFHERHPSAIDTFRVSALVGVEIPSGDDPISSDSLDPFVGLVATQISGRHGWNLALEYELTTGGKGDPLMPGEGLSDALRADANYLFRLTPATYTSARDASFYGVLELNATFETNGDIETLLSPGLLYEARNIGIEGGVQFPIVSDLELRPEREFSVVLGVRLLF